MEHPKRILIKNKDVYDATGALLSVTQEKMKLKVSHRFAMCLRALRTEQDTLEKMRERLIDDHVETDSEGNRLMGDINEATKMPTWRMKTANDFDKEWEELLEQTVEVTVYPVTLADLGSKFKMSALDMEPLLRVGILLEEAEAAEPKKEEEEEE